jgi:hypothetical protein
MRSVRPFLVVIALLAASAPSVGAVQWNPQRTAAGPFTGTKAITTGAGNPITCGISGYIFATGAIATTSNAAGTATPPTFSSCTNTINRGLLTCVTASSAWTFTATSLTTVDESNVNFVIRLVSGSTCATAALCTITASSVTLTGNAWSNATSLLTENRTIRFAITETGLCDGATTATLPGTITFPRTVTIS